jgi:hypothetical protein
MPTFLMPASSSATNVFDARAPLKQYAITGVSGVMPTVAHSATLGKRPEQVRTGKQQKAPSQQA